MNYERPVAPPRLFKYQSFSALSLSALHKRTLWFARPSSLNDPYDFNVPVHFEEVTRDDCAEWMASPAGWSDLKEDPRLVDEDGNPTEALCQLLMQHGPRAIRNKLEESYLGRGVTCFSEVPDSTLLWSHYGGGHRGFCLEFDTTAPILEKVHKVRYANDVPQLNIARELMGDGSSFMDVVLRKAECWSYEREWRAIHVEGNREYGYGAEALTGIYFGAAMPESDRDLIAQMLRGSPTRLYEAYRDESALNLNTRELTYRSRTANE
jgi:hypothetical protein